MAHGYMIWDKRFGMYQNKSQKKLLPKWVKKVHKADEYDTQIFICYFDGRLPGWGRMGRII
jgi:hypothetical protein